jgi:hypothetical protein
VSFPSPPKSTAFIFTGENNSFVVSVLSQVKWKYKDQGYRQI